MQHQFFRNRLQMRPLINSSLKEMHSDSYCAENYPLCPSNRPIIIISREFITIPTQKITVANHEIS